MALKPVEVKDVELAWGKTKGLLPDVSEIPKEFFNSSNKWNMVISSWFFKGLSMDTQVEPKEGVDVRAAIRHISAILKSFEPKHEHKIAGCAYLLSEFFESFDTKTESKTV